MLLIHTADEDKFNYHAPEHPRSPLSVGTQGSSPVPAQSALPHFLKEKQLPSRPYNASLPKTALVGSKTGFSGSCLNLMPTECGVYQPKSFLCLWLRRAALPPCRPGPPFPPETRRRGFEVANSPEIHGATCAGVAHHGHLQGLSMVALTLPQKATGDLQRTGFVVPPISVFRLRERVHRWEKNGSQLADPTAVTRAWEREQGDLHAGMRRSLHLNI